jgi:hypothetical protein
MDVFLGSFANRLHQTVSKKAKLRSEQDLLLAYSSFLQQG